MITQVRTRSRFGGRSKRSGVPHLRGCKSAVPFVCARLRITSEVRSQHVKPPLVDAPRTIRAAPSADVHGVDAVARGHAGARLPFVGVDAVAEQVAVHAVDRAGGARHERPPVSGVAGDGVHAVVLVGSARGQHARALARVLALERGELDQGDVVLEVALGARAVAALAGGDLPLVGHDHGPRRVRPRAIGGRRAVARAVPHAARVGSSPPASAPPDAARIGDARAEVARGVAGAPREGVERLRGRLPRVDLDLELAPPAVPVYAVRRRQHDVVVDEGARAELAARVPEPVAHAAQPHHGRHRHPLRLGVADLATRVHAVWAQPTGGAMHRERLVVRRLAEDAGVLREEVGGPVVEGQRVLHEDAVGVLLDDRQAHRMAAGAAGSEGAIDVVGGREGMELRLGGVAVVHVCGVRSVGVCEAREPRRGDRREVGQRGHVGVAVVAFEVELRVAADDESPGGASRSSDESKSGDDDGNHAACLALAQQVRVGLGGGGQHSQHGVVDHLAFEESGVCTCAG
eukprot:CAMPEP_0119352202 /NCGR_PEP_ID=MMETSP1334-20130426/1517_1 /TAXON_ID=127549 /ORGANISM="Calcidiscus leptoporus, Strain RCC1130" /LENGTH=517 /DNA_ID=CAMNT_0007365199 /DNA_START=388 /DNA_END=1941 /DNA_ORIENTATION=-